MEIAGANLTEVVRSLRLLKIEGYSMIQGMSSDDYFKYKWIFDGYEWEIRVYPSVLNSTGLDWFVGVRLIFLSEPRGRAVRTTLRCGLVGPRRVLCNERHDTIIFRKPQDSSAKIALTGEGYIDDDDDSFSVQCIIEVFKELPDIPPVPFKELHLPSSNLHQHFAQLLQSETGADVTFLVDGESFAAHKLILAARSPVFMAEFFGDMKEKCSPSVEIQDMEAAVFRALLQFIYTDTVSEFEQQDAADEKAIYADTEFGIKRISLGMVDGYIQAQKERKDRKDIIRLGCFREKEAAVTVMAQHLLAAADRYGLDRLKLICVGELSGGINVFTAATTLALAEQHNCPELKERCVQFIIRTSATLDMVLRTEEYKHLEASCPLVVIELFKAARERRS
jgi:speckle-type POZ protein